MRCAAGVIFLLRMSLPCPDTAAATSHVCTAVHLLRAATWAAVGAAAQLAWAEVAAGCPAAAVTAEVANVLQRMDA